MRFITITICILFPLLTFGQNHNLSITLKGHEGKNVILTEYYGERTYIVDSAVADNTGKVNFIIKESTLPGLFKIAPVGRDEFDLIYNKENVEVVTHVAAPIDSLIVIQSNENSLYYSFLEYDSKIRMKLELISPMMSFYPDEDKFFMTAKKHWINLQKMRNGHINDLAKNQPDAYATKLIKLYKTPFIEPSLSDIEKEIFMKAHFFDLVEFDDLALFRSNAYTNKVISYLSMFSSQTLSQEELEKEFIKGIDILMTKLDGNNEVYEFILEYLVGGFEKYRFEQVLDHIATNYQSREGCDDGDHKSTLQKRLDSYKNMAVGNIAPDLNTIDIDGNCNESHL